MEDVVIIGSGMAGSAAALALADAGRHALVIEARGRTGGRSYSRALGGSGPLEFGGSWCTPWHDRIRAHAERFGFGLRPTLPVTERRWHDGQTLRTAQPVSDSALPAFRAAMAALAEDSLAMRNGDGRFSYGSDWASMSFADYMLAKGFPPSAQHEMMAWWAISGSADPAAANVLDVLHFASHVDGTLDGMMAVLTHTVEGGVGNLSAAMLAASGAEVRTGDAVVAITDRGDHFDLRLSSGALVQAGQVVCATALNAIRTIRFDPPLPEGPATLAAKGHVGRAVKVLARVRGVTPGNLVTGKAHGLRWMFTERDLGDGETLIIAFGLADEMPDTSHAAIEAAIQTFFPEATLIEHDFHDWNRDPFSAGTWVSHPLGLTDLFEPGVWADHPRLHFATSDIAHAETGWFEGAIIAGEAAAAAILKGSSHV